MKFQSIVSSRASLTFLSTTVPTATPVNFTITDITSRAVSLLWYPLPFEQQNGVIRHYVVAANRTDNPPGFQLISNTTELTVENLSPNRMYTFAVAAETIEVGPFTIELTALLPEDGQLDSYKVMSGVVEQILIDICMHCNLLLLTSAILGGIEHYVHDWMKTLLMCLSHMAMVCLFCMLQPLVSS